VVIFKGCVNGMDYVIEIQSSGDKCWVRNDIAGDPGRTLVFENATRYATENEVNENLRAIHRQYPRRVFVAVPVEEKSPPLFRKAFKK